MQRSEDPRRVTSDSPTDTRRIVCRCAEFCSVFGCAEQQQSESPPQESLMRTGTKLNERTVSKLIDENIRIVHVYRRRFPRRPRLPSRGLGGSWGEEGKRREKKKGKRREVEVVDVLHPVSNTLNIIDILIYRLPIIFSRDSKFNRSFRQVYVCSTQRATIQFQESLCWLVLRQVFKG